MTPIKNTVANKYLWLAGLYFFMQNQLAARAGGGGGHSSSGGHSSGGFSSGSGGGFGGGYYGGGGSMSTTTTIIIIVVAVIFIYFILPKLKAMNAGADGDSAEVDPGANQSVMAQLQQMGESPTEILQKAETSFMSIQDAWQNKDLKKVRKWISDGVYQRFNAQFTIMNKLSQVNKLTNIKIDGVNFSRLALDRNYKVVDVAVSFTMDDEFVSEKYPKFNQKFKGENATEYWTFIKKQNVTQQKDLYNNDNCPNCGATFDVNMGEISRCSACGTLTNNASYDWVLSEITQADDYGNDFGLAENHAKLSSLQELLKHDDTFSVQRIEDVASNIFMQTMQVFSGENEKKLNRFADKATAASIVEERKHMGDFVFDRLYLNNVTLHDYYTENNLLNLVFTLRATYQRVDIKDKLKFIDADMVSKDYMIVLSKNQTSLQTPQKETVYSYECSGCGAPYADTTNDACPYCGEPVIDLKRNWVLTSFLTSNFDAVTSKLVS